MEEMSVMLSLEGSGFIFSKFFQKDLAMSAVGFLHIQLWI